MKKALAILMILALVGSAAFAEITFGAWGRGIFEPVYNSGVSGEKAVSRLGKSWTNYGDVNSNDNKPRVGFTVAGNSDNVGFQFDIYGDATVGDQLKIWVKPVSNVTVVMGKFFDDTLRGNGAFGSFNWDRSVGAGEGEDVTFHRMASGYQDKNWDSAYDGFMVTAAPTDAIFVAAALSHINGVKNEDMMSNLQIAGGYTIADIGQIRAQYYSAPKTVGTDIKADGTIEVAFKLTAVENLYADFGFRMFTLKDGKNANEEKDLSAYANYKVDAATIHALAIFKMNGDVNADGDKVSPFNLGAGVDYSLDGGIGVEADVRYYDKNWDKAGDGKAATAFFAGVKKGFSNGLIGLGFEVLNASNTAYAIPVRMEYWF
jgi:hypothetical protein